MEKIISVISMDLPSLKISATIIVISKDMKALIIQRLASEQNFPNYWTVAGGKIDSKDGVEVADGFMYFSSEYCAVRELMEETGIKVSTNDIKFLCTIVAPQINRLIISYYVVLDKNADEIKITLNDCQAYRWIYETLVDSYQFIPDIGGEIHHVFGKLRHA
jgi:8-oxo-dGTP pyrophosphatase MutT (NUDIX family)